MVKHFHCIGELPIGVYIRANLFFLIWHRLRGTSVELLCLKGVPVRTSVDRWLCRLTGLILKEPDFEYSTMRDPETGEWSYTRCSADITALGGKAKAPTGLARMHRRFGANVEHVARVHAEDEVRPIFPVLAAARHLSHPHRCTLYLRSTTVNALLKEMGRSYGLEIRFLSKPALTHGRRPLLRLALSLLRQRILAPAPIRNTQQSVLLTQDLTDLFADRSYRNQPHWYVPGIRDQVNEPIYVLKRPSFTADRATLERLRAENAFLIDWEKRQILPDEPLPISYRMRTASADSVSLLLILAVFLRPARYEAILLLLREIHWRECLMMALGTKVYISMQPHRLELQMAAQVCAAISIHYIVSSLSLVSHGHGADVSDFTCVFSPATEEFLRECGKNHGRVIVTGYPFLDEIATIRARAQETKQRLRAAGAALIITLFDENWLEGKYSPVTRADHVKYLAFFLDWILENPRVGIVLKTKYVKNMPVSFTELRERVEKVNATGRLFVFTEGQHEGRNLPAEAALTGDVCLGIIYGATAALEGALAGVRTFLLDEHQYRYARLPKGAREKIVVTTLAELRRRCESALFLQSSDGDWADFLHLLEPFQDQKSGRRFADLVIACLREKGPDQAYAAFSQQWPQAVAGLTGLTPH